VTNLAFSKNSTDNISSMIVVFPGATRLQQMDSVIDDLFDTLVDSEPEVEEATVGAPAAPLVVAEQASRPLPRSLSLSRSAQEVEEETEA